MVVVAPISTNRMTFITPTILFLLADCPGYYVALIEAIAKQLKQEGMEVIFASTTPYYEQYKGVNLSELGIIYYLSDFLLSPDASDTNKLDQVKLNYWWTYATFVRDTFFYGQHRNQWDIYKKVVLFYQHILSRHIIALAVSEPPSNSFLHIGFHQLLQRDIPYLGYISARIPHHVNVFLDEYGENLQRNHQFNQTTISIGPPDYMQDQHLQLYENGMGKKLWRMITTPSPYSLESGHTIFHQIRSYYTRVWRHMRHQQALRADIFTQELPETNNFLILFPLQYRPEASTSVLARYYENDAEVIKNIAFSLPPNAQLIVKEHQAAVGMRDMSFYHQILSYPNTTLLHPEYSLSANWFFFDAAIVLTSTVGFEALQAGIPVFVLGNVFFANYSGAIPINSYHALEQHLRQLVKRSSEPNPDILVHYQQFCFEGQFNYLNPAVLSSTNIQNLLIPIRQQLDELSKVEIW